MKTVFIIIISLALAYIIWKYIISKMLSKGDYYAFGLLEAIAIKKALKSNDYHTAENVIKRLNADDLTQTMDLIGLSLHEEALTNWLKKSRNVQIPQLALGVFYGHEAWRARSNSLAEEVSNEAASLFFELQDKAKGYLRKIEGNPKLEQEAFSRLIRTYMSLEDLENAYNYFQKAIAINKDHLWAYIHYAEAIQPKWGGNIAHIAVLMSQLPERDLIRHIVELKLITDSLTMDENYFEGDMDSFNQRASNALATIDAEVSQNPPKSVHRYIVYNYLFVLANQVGNQKIRDKNYKKMNGISTLYPFGIV